MISIAFASTEKGHCMLDNFCLGILRQLEMALTLLLFSLFKVVLHDTLW